MAAGDALAIAALSAIGFALSTSLQHHENSDLGPEISTVRAVATLLRRPRWVAGQLIAFASFGLHAWAVSIGDLVLVQPVVVSGIVLAIPLHAALAHRLPHLGELATVALTATGLGLFLVSADPSRSHPPRTAVAAVATVAGLALAAIVTRAADRASGFRCAAGYGAAAGVMFGMTAGLVKASAAAAAGHPGLPQRLLALAEAWPAWGVVVTGVAGVVLNQRAYRAGGLSASMPVLNIVDVVIAIGFGVAVFGEIPAHGLGPTSAQVAGLLLIAAGLRRLHAHHQADDAPAPGDPRSPASAPRAG